MAYAGYEDYLGLYYGDVLTEDNADKWLDRASDELDTITRGRLTFAFPTVEAHAKKVKKAVCALAEALLQIDRQAMVCAPQIAEDGSYRGRVASVSSGDESISYAAAGKETSAFAAAAASDEAKAELLAGIASRYLSGIPDANGINLLYAGG